MATRTLRPHLSHWGAFDAEVVDGALVAIHPFEHDPDPSPLLRNVPGSLRHPTRVSQPMVREGWLTNGPGPSERRGEGGLLTPIVRERRRGGSSPYADWSRAE